MTMNEYTVSEHELKYAQSLMGDVFKIFKEDITQIQTDEELELVIEEGSLIAAGIIQWIENVKENNLIIKGEENDGEATKDA
jgi:hypothetical protein